MEAGQLFGLKKLVKSGSNIPTTEEDEADDSEEEAEEESDRANNGRGQVIGLIVGAALFALVDVASVGSVRSGAGGLLHQDGVVSQAIALACGVSCVASQEGAVGA